MAKHHPTPAQKKNYYKLVKKAYARLHQTLKKHDPQALKQYHDYDKGNR